MTIPTRVVPLKASVTATFSAPKNSRRALGRAIFQKIVKHQASGLRSISRSFGSSVESPIASDAAMGMNGILKATGTVLTSC